MARAFTDNAPPVSRVVDLIVLILVIGALLVGWQLRQIALFSTKNITVQDLSVGIPTDSIPLSGDDELAFVTPDGLIVRINILPAPPIGIKDPLALVTDRTVSQEEAHDVYQTIANDTLTLEERPAGLLEYAYVDEQNDSFFASSLQVIRGFELLVGQGDEVYVVTLEAPDHQFDAVETLWPRLQDSLRLKRGQS